MYMYIQSRVLCSPNTDYSCDYDDYDYDYDCAYDCDYSSGCDWLGTQRRD